MAVNACINSNEFHNAVHRSQCNKEFNRQLLLLAIIIYYIGLKSVIIINVCIGTRPTIIAISLVQVSQTFCEGEMTQLGLESLFFC